MTRFVVVIVTCLMAGWAGCALSESVSMEHASSITLPGAPTQAEHHPLTAVVPTPSNHNQWIQLADNSDVQGYSSEAINPTVYASAHTLDASPHFAQQLCQLPGYRCKKVKANQTWASLFPNYDTREVIMRLNRTNVALGYLSWIVLPQKMKNIDYMTLSPMPLYRKPVGHKVILVNLSMFAFGAYNEEGTLEYWGPATSGATTCPGGDDSCRTVTGRYAVYRKQGADCISHTYPRETNGGASMPYCMHFYKGFAIHGSTLAGFYNHSQGCVRLFYDDAKWLNTEFADIGTEVIVQQS